MAEKQKVPRWLLWVGGISLLIIILFFFMPGNEPIKSSVSQYDGSYKLEPFYACIKSQHFIENQLKAPSTAKFKACPTMMGSTYATDSKVDYLGNRTYNVFTYVDSQNGFGAMIRTNFLVQILHNQDDTWSQLSIVSSED